MGVTIDGLIEGIKTYLPPESEARIRKAYALAEKAHEGQVRFSGHAYITHPLETACILLPLQPDEETLIAALLHDVPRDTEVPLKVIEKEFDRTVARLVSGTEKLGMIKMQKGESQVEVWRKMVLAMAKDLRVVFIKLAERLHNMRTLEYVAVEKQKRIAEETLRVYAPIASRLGIYSLKSELEDLAFRFLNPREYEELSKQFLEGGSLHQRYIDEAKSVLTNLLNQEGIEAEISGRVKHLYSLYRKLSKKNLNVLESVYDLFAMRIVLPDQYREGKEFVGHCYTTLGILHNRWTPMPGRFKDYIAVPKLNGYRSLHTTVIGLLPFLKNQPLEIQIRTQSMHQESEYGVASHWWYKDSSRASSSIPHEEVERFLSGRRLINQFHQLLEEFPGERNQFEHFLSPGGGSPQLEATLRRFLETHEFSPQDVTDLLVFLREAPPEDSRLKTLQHQMDWLYGLQAFTEDSGAEGPLDPADLDLFNDRIFVLTPHGEVKDLPLESTPIDFAYAIHTDLGHRCHQVKVNGSIARLDQPLNSGDIVEIITRKDPQPNRYWLSFAKTTLAKNRIKAWFRGVDREKNIRAGRELINRELRRLSKPLLGPNYQLLTRYGGKPLDPADREHVVELVGNGTLTANHVVRMLFSDEELMGERIKRVVVHTPTVVAPVLSESEKEAILITGESNLPITRSSCCKPRFPHEIVGYVTRGKSIRVHRTSCHLVDDIPPERLLDASWAVQHSDPHYQVCVRIKAHDRVGLMRDIVTVVADLQMNIVDFPLVQKGEGEVTRDLLLEISSYDLLAKLLSSLERVPGVESVQKT